MVDNNFIVNPVTGRKIKNLAGKTFGKLTVIGLSSMEKKRRVLWECLCECGSIKAIRQDALVRNASKSCGCLHRDITRRQFTKHEGAPTTNYKSEYNAWRGLIERCENPCHKAYKNYGGRGISVCKEWKHSFKLFFEHIGPKPSKDHSIDRIDNDKPYQPGNVKWSTWHEQASNKRNNIFLNFEGEIKTLTDWASELKVSKTALWWRREKGWCDFCVLSIPFDKNGLVRSHSCLHR